MADNPPTMYNDFGVVNFGVEDFNIINPKKGGYNHPFFRLLLSLWPGDWEEQLKKMNAAIRINNAGKEPQNQTKECTEDE